MPDTAHRLNTLNLRLQALVAENHALRARWVAAATDAQRWPDMNVATRLFMSLQTVSRMLDNHSLTLPRTNRVVRSASLPLNMSHGDVPILCPKCAAVTSTVLYRSFSTASLMCPECEHIWMMPPDAHAALLTIPFIQLTH
jgi:hypothetical protein